MAGAQLVADRSQPRVGLLSQLTRFVLVGGLSALVDYGLYQALLHTGLWVHGAKALSFVCGTTTAYLLNRRFTFTQTAGGATRFTGFLLLYGTTFFVNVGMNALVLHLITEGAPFRVTIAWVFAQGTATMINFLMLRYVVFRR